MVEECLEVVSSLCQSVSQLRRLVCRVVVENANDARSLIAVYAEVVASRLAVRLAVEVERLFVRDVDRKVSLEQRMLVV